MGDQSSPLIIHQWSGPRSMSTAVMYSFAQRKDFHVLDEPLYGQYLRRNPNLTRPYRDELLAMDSHLSESEILLQIQSLANGRKGQHVFCKHIAKQLSANSEDDWKSLCQPNSRHIILIRDPWDMLEGWENVGEVHGEEVDLDSATNLPALVELFSHLRRNSVGRAPLVVSCSLLSQHPETILRAVCAQLNIAFDPNMLQWEAGPKACDGLWAKWWYQSVHKSTGFQSKTAVSKMNKFRLLSDQQRAVYLQALPYYDFLKSFAIGLDALSPHSCSLSPGLMLQLSASRGDTPSVSDPRLSDSRNSDILIWIGDRLVPRQQACISVFDSAVQGGDAVWEGIRVYNGKVFKLDEHLRRLADSSKALLFQGVPSKDFITAAIFRTLGANQMRNGVHMRLTLTRGVKVTSSMNPVFNMFGTTLIIIPEWKAVGDATTYDNCSGIKLVTATNRRNPPSCLDSKIHHCNLINNILPKIQANNAGCHDAIMLDLDGFVAETNATNLFMVKNGRVFTPCADACLPGFTRETVMTLLATRCTERRLSLAEFHAADEVFTTGTMGEITPVTCIDNRIIGDGCPGPITAEVQSMYRLLTEEQGTPLPF